VIEAPLRSELERCAAVVREHPGREALGAFAYDVLSVQAEGRSLFAGQKFMAQRAEAHGVTRDDARTSLGNLLGILERGASDSTEVALVAAFAMHGFAKAIERAQSAERVQLAQKLVAHADWLEVATAYRILPLLSGVEDGLRDVAINALVDAVLRDDTDRRDSDSASRARNALRIAALAALDAETARTGLGRIVRDAKDPSSRALARVASGDEAAAQPPAASGQPLRVFGRSRTSESGPVRSVLRWVTGYALFLWVGRMLGFLLSSRRQTELELDRNALRVRKRTTLFGRTVRSFEASYDVGALAYAERGARYALVRSVVSVFSLSLGLLIGGHFIFDGARGGAPLLLTVGALVVALGTGLDLALEVLGPAARGRAVLRIGFRDARPVALADIPVAEADRFLSALAERLAGARR
jgi:hypothetical protein